MRTLARIGLLSLILSLFGAAALAQQGPPPDDNGNGPPPRGNFDPNSFRQRMMDDLKQRLATSDEDFGAIQPKLESVMQLKRDAESRMRPGPPPGPPPDGQGPNDQQGGGGPQMGGPPGGDNGGPPRDQNQPQPANSEVQQAARDLHEALDNPDTSSADIKAKVDAVRAARAAAREKLAKAEQDLIQVLTPHQEAVLVDAGLLD